MTIETIPNKGLTAKSSLWVGELRIEIPKPELGDRKISFVEHLLESSKAQAKDNGVGLRNDSWVKKQGKKKVNIPADAENRIVNEQTIVYK